MTEYKSPVTLVSKICTDPENEIMHMINVKYGINVDKDKLTDLINKSEPKKVKYGNFNTECPTCCNPFDICESSWGCNYCPECGQKLEWDKPDFSIDTKDLWRLMDFLK